MIGQQLCPITPGDSMECDDADDREPRRLTRSLTSILMASEEVKQRTYAAWRSSEERRLQWLQRQKVLTTRQAEEIAWIEATHRYEDAAALFGRESAQAERLLAARLRLAGRAIDRLVRPLPWRDQLAADLVAELKEDDILDCAWTLQSYQDDIKAWAGRDRERRAERQSS
jgi:hypothetical protein